MGLKLKEGWRNISKQLLAAGLSLMMIGGSLDLSASVAAAQTTEPQATVAALEPLAEGIQEQQTAAVVSESGITRLADGANKDIAVTNATASGSAIEKHTHHWTYRGSGNSNIMTCICDSTVGTCPVENQMTWITVNGTNTVYDGRERELSIYVNTKTESGQYIKTLQELGITLPEFVYEKGGTGTLDGTSIAGKPVDAGEYFGYLIMNNGARARAQILIQQVTPVVKQQPIPTSLTYGEMLGDSELRNGAMKVSETDATEVKGTFTWKEPEVRPTVADSGTIKYTILFTPADQTNYASVELESTLTVMKAENAPHMPDKVKGVFGSVTKVGDVKLPTDWAWVAVDQDTGLEIGVPVTATAEYTGADKGNYIYEQVAVQITRSACEHAAGDVLYTGTGEHAPTCTVDGIGHTECTKCGDLVDSDIVVKAAHKFSAEWTVDVEATTTTEGSKSHHCTVCDEKTDITVIPKLPVPSGGGSSSGGGTVTPAQPEQPSGTKEDYIVPVKNENTVEIDASITSDGKASIGEITQDTLEKLVNSADETSKVDTIHIDLSGAKEKVTGVTLTKKTMDALAQVAADQNSGIDSVTLELADAMVSLDAKTLQLLAEQTKGGQIGLVVEDTVAKNLNTSQQEALNRYTNVTTFEAYIESDDTRIHDFNGGKVSLGIRFTPKEGTDARYYHIVYVAEDGMLTRFETRYEDGMLKFETGHFSDYAIIYDTTSANATEQADATPAKLNLRAGRTTKTTQRLTWGKVEGTDGYEIYVAPRNTKNKTYRLKLRRTVKSTRTGYTVKGLKHGTAYRYVVKAYRIVDGKKVYVARSATIRVTTKGNK